ncbi:MAG: HlyD family secretion protein [Candidatus Omnitrophica bacterium]|nr:HlyD family secretion protein [Candidatus Omnitrophota bacterium]
MEQAKGKNKKFMAVLILGFITAGGFVGFHILNNLGQVSTDDSYITGRIHSIAPKIPGTVKAVLVEDNQAVKKGDLIIEIDPVDHSLQVGEAQAMVGVREAGFEQAARDMKRSEALYKDGVFSREKFENAATANNLAQAQLNASREQLRIAQRNLEYTKIYSPTDGYVTGKSVEEGNQVQPGQPLFAVVALDDIWVVANYKETQLKDVKRGQRVRIKVDTYAGKVFTGKVDSIMAGTGAAFSLFPPENALGNYVKVVQRIPVKIVFDKTTDDGHALRIGMSSIASIDTK